MKLLLTLALLLIATGSSLQVASAHVLITDDSRHSGAILHINPDDDPVAGEQSQLYFDTQNQLASDDVRLDIKGPGSTLESPKAVIDGTLATLDYTFPAQGIYELTFTVTDGKTTQTYSHSQRVSRGVNSSAGNSPKHTWAEILLVTSGLGLIIIVILVFNYRNDIAKRSIV